MALNSSSVIKIIDLLCEGPIQGLVNGKQGIFLNDTPVADNKKFYQVGIKVLLEVQQVIRQLLIYHKK